MSILYGETKFLIEDLLIDYIKNSQDQSEKDRALRSYKNFSEFICNLKPSGLFGSET